MKEKIYEIIARELKIPVNELNDNINLIEDLYADSLDIYEIILELENQFDLVIPYDVAEGFSTIGDFVRYIESQQKFHKPDAPHRAARRAVAIHKGPSENWY